MNSETRKKVPILWITVFSLLMYWFGAFVSQQQSSASTDIANTGSSKMPEGAIIAVDRTQCPSGWYPIEKPQGRVIVGLSPGGSLAQKNDINSRVNVNTLRHFHVWAIMSSKTWRSRTGDNNQGIDLIEWTDGMNSNGSGLYLYALAEDDLLLNGGTIFRTSEVIEDVPFIQYLYCTNNETL